MRSEVSSESYELSEKTFFSRLTCIVSVSMAICIILYPCIMHANLFIKAKRVFLYL